MSDIQFTKISHDVNGNPRYVCHYLNLLTYKEAHTAYEWDRNGRRITPTRYEIAVSRAHKIGGRKYHTKAYGGGIVFQSYSLQELEQAIKGVVAEAEQKEARS